MSEGFKSRNRLTGRALALTPVLALTMLAACGSDKEAPKTCTSPIAKSDRYPGDPNADPKDRGTWTTGVLATTEVHPEAQGLIVGYRAPHAPEWTESKKVSPEWAKDVALLIGDGEVVFMTQTVAALGSAACDKPPATVFSPSKPLEELLGPGITFPNW